MEEKVRNVQDVMEKLLNTKSRKEVLLFVLNVKRNNLYYVSITKGINV